MKTKNKYSMYVEHTCVLIFLSDVELKSGEAIARQSMIEKIQI